MQTVNDIRKAFLDFFRGRGHEIVPSSSLVPHNDPTLLFTNAGMVQFKNVFTGVEPRDYKRAATSQKCVRAGGKHNDLDNVGYTARHHTFFEMLGNFSFGDYFKEEAIDAAWTLVTKEFGLPADRLLATVYHDDDEAFGLWRKIAGLPEDRVIRIPTSDNFWAMGDTGPCGPCSEIFFDHGPGIPGGPPGSPDEDGDRFIEIWNLVFMQFEQVDAATRIDLPRPSIDTGMGLERIAAVMQGKHDNYEIDLFARIIEASVELTGAPDIGANRPSHKVIADHLRASAFLLADGVTPSNEGRGYVLRRIMRRGMRHAHMLGAREPLMWRLVPVLVGLMGDAFGELRRAEASIVEWLRLEETNFRRTLERGLRLLEDETRALGEGEPLAGETAFKLYDTYGFPLDLTQDALRAGGRGVDEEGFRTAMERQRAEARKHWKGSGEASVESLWYDIRDEHGATEFLGYGAERSDAKVLAIVRDGAVVERAVTGDRVSLVTNQTVFYGESGGQVGDTGEATAEGVRVHIDDTLKKLGDLFIHQGTVEEGSLETGATLTLAIDSERRRRLRRAHSATHLMHAALRRRLGDHVAQKGSLVAPDRLRFDFSHPRSLTAEDLAAVEAEVNHFLRRNDPADVRVMAIADAIDAGAMALFGEKYGEEVRVVTMGLDESGAIYSMELCGGTHIGRTGDIALFKIVSEGAVASGVRRIEALTGEAAFDHVRTEEGWLDEVAGALRTTPSEVGGRVRGLLDERRRLEQEVTDLRRRLATGEAGGSGGESVKDVGGIAFSARVIEGLPARELRGAADALKKELGEGVVALIAVNDGKAALVVAVSDGLGDRVDAVSLLRAGVDAVGGKGGGGRADFAQGGGPDGARAGAAVEAIENALARAVTG